MNIFDRFVSEKIAKGRFNSASEVIRAGLRRLEEEEAKLEALKAKLQAGEESPIIEDFDGGKFLKRMHEKHLR